MSARERIENLWSRSFAVGPYLDAYRDEVLREAAAKIRRHDWAAHTVGQRCCDDLTDEAADLIDPDKEN
ncbi:MAG: hypothetical protein ACTHON_18235 [Humibacter sp.]